MRPQLTQHAAKAADVAERVALADGDVGEAHVEFGRQPLAALEVAVHGNDGVAPRVGITVGDGGESHLRAADGERREDVQQQRRLRR